MLRIHHQHNAFKAIVAGSGAFAIGLLASGVLALGSYRYDNLSIGSERQAPAQSTQTASPVETSSAQASSGDSDQSSWTNTARSSSTTTASQPVTTATTPQSETPAAETSIVPGMGGGEIVDPVIPIPEQPTEPVGELLPLCSSLDLLSGLVPQIGVNCRET